MNFETEIKFKVKDFTSVEKRLRELNFKEGRWLRERNYVFDDKERTFKQKDSLLRLREANNKIILTFKGPREKSNLKTREEIETEVSDFKEMSRILHKLGYSLHWIYEKKRKTFSKENIKVVFDMLPFIGNWLEIEGPEGLINQTIKDLDLNLKDSTTAVYGELAEEYFNKGINLTFEEEEKRKCLPARNALI